MFRDVFSSRSLLVGLVFFVFVVGGSLLYSWHVQSTSQEVLHRTLQQLETRNGKSVSTENVQPTQQTDALQNETSFKKQGTATSDVSRVPKVDTSETFFESPQDGELSTGSDFVDDDLDTSKELYFGNYKKEDLIKIRDWAKDLEENLLANYSELAALAHMTPDEIAERYPTEADRKYLAELAEEMFNFYGEEIGALLRALPVEMRGTMMTNLRDQLTHNWGAEAANKIMTTLDQ